MRVVPASTEADQVKVTSPVSRSSVAEITLVAGAPMGVNVNAPARLTVNVWMAVLPR